MRALLAHRDARLYLAGQSFSLLGDTALWLALALWARMLTGSSSAGALVIFCLVLPTLGSPATGLIVDRVRRRRLLLAVNPLTALAVLPLLIVHDSGDIYILYGVAFIYGVSYTLLGAGQSALLATMLPEELLAPANAVLQTVREGLRLVAPVAGVGLFTLAGGSAVAILDAATFLIATATLLAIRFDEPRPRRDGEPVRTALAAGARHLQATPPLRAIVLACAAALAVLGFSETLLFAIPQALHRPPSFAAVLMLPQGAGAVAGALTATAVLRRHGERAMVGFGLTISALGAATYADPSVAVVLAGKVLYGLGLPWALIGLSTFLQRTTPGRLQGRVWAASELLLGTPQTLSIAIGAVLLTVVDYRVLVAAETIGLALAGGWLLVRTQGLSPETNPQAEDGRDMRT